LSQGVFGSPLKEQFCSILDRARNGYRKEEGVLECLNGIYRWPETVEILNKVIEACGEKSLS
jgi:hypothetical protein